MLLRSARSEQRCGQLRHDGAVRSCALSADGRRVAIGTDQGMVKLWTSEGPAHHRAAHGIRALAVAPGGERVVTLDRQGAMVLRHLASGAEEALPSLAEALLSAAGLDPP